MVWNRLICLRINALRSRTADNSTIITTPNDDCAISLSEGWSCCCGNAKIQSRQKRPNVSVRHPHESRFPLNVMYVMEWAHPDTTHPGRYPFCCDRSNLFGIDISYRKANWLRIAMGWFMQLRLCWLKSSIFTEYFGYHYWPSNSRPLLLFSLLLFWESTNDHYIPLTKGQQYWKIHVIMSHGMGI